MKQELNHTELRCGNLVYNPYLKEIRTVDYLDIRDHAEKILYTPFECIELTPEWLDRFGFEKVNNSYDLDKISFAAPSLTNRFGRVYFNSWAILEQWPRHVHQLQNLFFALTGRELKLKK